jgi:hypothetical protein
MRWAEHVALTVEMRNIKGSDHLEDVDAGGRIVLESILEVGWKGVNWIYLAEDR